MKSALLFSLLLSSSVAWAQTSKLPNIITLNPSDARIAYEDIDENGTAERVLRFSNTVNNIGAGAQIEDVLYAYEITGHFRWF